MNELNLENTVSRGAKRKTRVSKNSLILGGIHTIFGHLACIPVNEENSPPEWSLEA